MGIHEKETKLKITEGRCETGQSRLFLFSDTFFGEIEQMRYFRAARIIKRNFSSLTEQTAFVLTVTSD